MDGNRNEKTRIKTILDYHVGRDRNLKTVTEQIHILNLKKRRFLFITFINVLALIFFAYWFFSDITQLSEWIFLVVLAVFVLNLLSVFYQKKQIEQAMDYLKSEERAGSR